MDINLAIDRIFHWYKSPLTMHDTYVEGNMANISQTIPINISNNPNIVESIFIGEYYSPKEIKTYTSLLKEYVTFLLGYVKKCEALIPRLSNMRSKHIQMKNLFKKK